MKLSPAALAIARGDIDELLRIKRAEFGDARMDAGGAGSGDGGSGSGSGGSGDAGSGSGDGGTGGAGGAGATGSGANGSFTQADLDRIAGQRAAEAKRAAIKDIAEKLGMTPDEAAKFIADKKAADEAALGEEERRRRELEERERAAEERDRQAAARERQASIREALAEAGATGQELRDAAVLIAAGLDDAADGDAITTAVDELKKRRAELFKGTTAGAAGTHTDTGSGNNGGGSGGGNGSGGSGSSSKLAAGAEKARELGIVREPASKAS